MSIYTSNSALSADQVAQLKSSANNQNQLIFSILKEDPTKGYAIFEMIEITDIHPNSVNRALSSMSSENGSAAEKFKDSNGNMPIIKSKDHTVFNSSTGKTCCTYWYNSEYRGNL